MRLLVGPPSVLTVAGVPFGPRMSVHSSGPSEPEGTLAVSEVVDQLADTFGFKLAGRGWTKQNRESIKIVWQTLDAVSCTDYLKDLQGKVRGTVGLNATSIRGYAWGDWSLTRSGYVSLDFTKFQKAIDSGDTGRLSRLVTHELAHTLNSDRYSEPKYWRDFKRLHQREGRFSKYAGRSVTETFADVVGYYVGGREFGPAPGTKADCSAPAKAKKVKKAKKKAEPKPAAWLEGLGDE